MKENSEHGEMVSAEEAALENQTADSIDKTGADTVGEESVPVKPVSESGMELRRLVEEQAREDERPHSYEFTLKKILGGEFLTARLLKDHVLLILLIVGFIIIYVSNRYVCDHQRIEISQLNKELQDARYRALSSSSNLTRMSRESYVLEMLRQTNDSMLHIATQPPYIINVPEK